MYTSSTEKPAEKPTAAELASDYGKTALRGAALGFGIYVLWTIAHTVLFSVVGGK